MLTILIVLLIIGLLFGGWGYAGGPSFGAWGWSPAGLILLIIVILLLTGTRF